MTWIEWNERIGSKIIDRAFVIARERGIENPSLKHLGWLLKTARLQLSLEAGLQPYEDVTE